MDISETYCEMCSKAQEIQKNWLPGSGDFLRLRGADYIDVASDKYDAFREDGDVWLLRQDQLQEMLDIDMWEIRAYPPNELAGLHQFEMLGYLPDGQGLLNAEGNTLEQLLLILVMKRKFRKCWDGQDWVLKEQQEGTKC